MLESEEAVDLAGPELVFLTPEHGRIVPVVVPAALFLALSLASAVAVVWKLTCYCHG